MEHIRKYNELFFEDDKIANINFWNHLSNFDIAHPEAQLTVIHDVRKDRHLGKYVEFLEFQCCLEKDKQRVQEIYRRDFFLVPLTFRPNLDCEPTDEEVHFVGKLK